MKNAIQKKEIIFVLPSFRGGGAERAMIVIARELSKLDHLNITLISLSSEGPLRDLAKQLNVVDLNKSRARKAFFPLRKYLKTNNPDIVFSVLPQANILLYLIQITTKNDWKTVHMLQNYYEKIIAREGNIVSYLFKKSLESADLVIPNSKEMAENLAERTNILPENVYPIYNPIDTDSIKNLSKQDVDEPFYQQHPVLVGCGSLDEQKGFAYLLDAFSQIKKEYEDAKLVILGEGPLEQNLKKQAEKLGVREDVHFLGFVDNPYKYMRAADLFVLSSLWEGLPTVLIEALATGVPVVATKCPSGPKEILDNGRFGLLVPTGNADALARGVINALENDKLQSVDTSDRADVFSIKRIIPEFEKIAKGNYAQRN